MVIISLQLRQGSRNLFHILIVVRLNVAFMERKSMAGFFVRIVAPYMVKH
jgi:hypothetical protein